MELIKTPVKALIRSQRNPTLMLLKGINSLLRKLSSLTHRAQLYCQWSVKPNPEWFDHFIDQHHQWHRSQSPFPWERGIFNLLAIKEKANVLELCCGDGFNAHHFYAVRAKQVVSVDFDPEAIRHAKKHFKAKNVEYQLADIRQSLPEGSYHNILWDAAIEHFTLDEINQIIRNIQSRLTADGILSGYTLIADPDGPGHDDHENEFESKNELSTLLKQHFKHVVVFDTKYPERHNLYFFASQEPMRFLEDFQTN